MSLASHRVVCVFLPCCYDNVVYVDLDVSSNLLLEAVLHHALVGCACVLEAEKHCGVAVEPKWGYERRFLFILFLHPYLVVTRVSIQEGQASAPGGGVDDLVDSR